MYTVACHVYESKECTIHVHVDIRAVKYTIQRKCQEIPSALKYRYLQQQQQQQQQINFINI